MKDIITLFSNKEASESPEGRTARFNMILPLVLDQYDGNILEIGAGVGHSTKVFLKHAWANDRKVVVVDPWITLAGDQHGYGVYSYEEFLENTKGFDNLVIFRGPSTGNVKLILDHHNPFAFAFVDGLQDEATVTHDLYLCQQYHTKVIAVDDFNRDTKVSKVRPAVFKFVDQNPEYELVHTRNNIECYLIKS